MKIWSWITNLFQSKKQPVYKSTGVKRALVVGINKYTLPNAELNGCINDANDVINLLTTQYGFQMSNITFLKDERATKENILMVLGQLIADAKEGDELVYYHSGHGTQVTDLNNNEDDKLAECLVTYDFDWDDVNTQMTDDVLVVVLKPLVKGAWLTIIVDSCHSATATRTLDNPHSIKRQARHIINPKLKAGMTARYINHFGCKDIVPTMQRHIMFSGCRDDEVSEELEMNGLVRGVMTYNLTNRLRAREYGNWTLLHDDVVKAVKTARFKQHPCLSGSADVMGRSPFGGRA